MAQVVFGRFNPNGVLIESIKGSYLVQKDDTVQVWHQDVRGEDTIVGVFQLDKGFSVQRTDMKV
jgi:hypothetical protein